jgi:hypothetical protein
MEVGSLLAEVIALNGRNAAMAALKDAGVATPSLA